MSSNNRVGLESLYYSERFAVLVLFIPQIPMRPGSTFSLTEVERSNFSFKIRIVKIRLDAQYEPTCTFWSPGNVRIYPIAKSLVCESPPVSVHDILNDNPLAVFGASADASVVHEHPVLFVNGSFKYYFEERPFQKVPVWGHRYNKASIRLRDRLGLVKEGVHRRMAHT